MYFSKNHTNPLLVTLICLLITVLGGEGVLCAQTWSDSIKTVDSLYTRALFDAYALKQYRAMRDSAFSAVVLPKQHKLKTHEKWFGPGKLKAKLQGRAEASLGIKYVHNQNPDLPYNARKRVIPEFDENIELSFDGSLGEKLKMKTHFTTDPFNEKNLSNLYLGYTGYEDEIIRDIEAGSVTLHTENRLINSTSSLFGIKAGIQLGPLTVDFLAASESNTVVLYEEGGGGNLRAWELEIDAYDEHRHFFLSHFFRNHFTQHTQLACLNKSPLFISRIEVWITNTQGILEDSRHVAAIAQLGDVDNLHDKPVANEGSLLYQQLINSGSKCRNVGNTSELQSMMQTYNADCELMRRARRLLPEEYELQSALGYVSLKRPLQSYEQLAVAYEYTYQGRTYQVGEWTDLSETSQQEAVFVRLLKPAQNDPSHYAWKLMMKNIYTIPNGCEGRQGFEFDVLVRKEEFTDYTPFLEHSGTKTLLQILQLDQVGPNNRNGPDGRFDYVENTTILPTLGCIVFPLTEPFGDYLSHATSSASSSYACQALYDSTLVKARALISPRQIVLRGKSKSKQRGVYKLKDHQCSPGSLLVKAQDKELVENVDYTIDPENNLLTIINEEYLLSNAGISVSTKQSSFLYGNRQTRLGLNLNYNVNRSLSLGASWMMVQAKPRFESYASADEFVSNTIYGLHSRYVKSWKTRMGSDSIQAKNTLVWNTDVAFLLSKSAPKGSFFFIDDFESNHVMADLSQPSKWSLSSIPIDGSQFPESLLSNAVETGLNRALINWYTLEPSFVKPGSKYLPEYLRYDKEALSNHYVRNINASELFPNRDVDDTDQRYISSFNLSFYPNERGPYNLDASDITSEGFLLHPKKRWGGIMRSIDASDFETQHVQYLEFWLLDPFLYWNGHQGGTLSIDLGTLSEDVLKDNLLSDESSIDLKNDLRSGGSSIWGVIPQFQTGTKAFDGGDAAVALQDVGLNGLSGEDEAQLEVYKTFLDRYYAQVDASSERERMLPRTVASSPSGERYVGFSDKRYTNSKASFHERMKGINGTEGNSGHEAMKEFFWKYSPDSEDLDHDMTLSTEEHFYRYQVNLSPGSLNADHTLIKEVRQAEVIAPDGTASRVSWYLFRIPLRNYSKRFGSIADFKSIRHMRLLLHGFEEEVHLRFASLRFVKSDWQQWVPDTKNDSLYWYEDPVQLAYLSVDENQELSEVNYITPNGVEPRTVMHNRKQVRENEHALEFEVESLHPTQHVAVWKQTDFDCRNYGSLELFSHLHETISTGSHLADGDFSLFVRLGYDGRTNYYEYEIPMVVTPLGQYSNQLFSDKETVWPRNNRLDIILQQLTAAKNGRDVSGVSKSEIFSTENMQHHTIRIKGNPSLADVTTIVVGVRNNSDKILSGKVWINDIRLAHQQKQNGWAARSELELTLGDMGRFSVEGAFKSRGFGNVDQRYNERIENDRLRFGFTSRVEFGKVLPSALRLTMPVYLQWSKESEYLHYNPFDNDIEMDELLKQESNQSTRDSLRRLARSTISSHNIAIQQMGFRIRSKQPMPYDLDNFRLGFVYDGSSVASPSLHYDRGKRYSGYLRYTYSPDELLLPFFKKASTQKQEWLRLRFVPTQITMESSFYRNYGETKYRLNEGDHATGASFVMQEFLWNRAFTLEWDLLKNIKLRVRTATNAEIEEPEMQVNKRIDPDGFRFWRDSVWNSIKDFGKPVRYEQQVALHGHIPEFKNRWLGWIKGSMHYKADYFWDRGYDDVVFGDGGNIIKNYRSTGVNGTFNLSKLASALDSSSVSRTSLLKKLLPHIEVIHKTDKGMQIPRYRHGVRDIGGQNRVDGHLLPGIGFALGAASSTFINKVINNADVHLTEETTNRAITSTNRYSLWKGVLRPVSGLRFELSWLSDQNNRDELALNPNAQSSQISRKSNSRVASRRKSINASKKTNINSLIAPQENRLVLPNWKVYYDGLNRYDFIKKVLNHLAFTHAYSCIHSVEVMHTGERNVASKSVDKKMVSAKTWVKEGFTPLVGIDAIFRNGLTASLRHNKIYSIVLNHGGNQLINGVNQDINLAFAYKIVADRQQNGKKYGSFSDGGILLKVEGAARRMTNGINYKDAIREVYTSGNKSYFIRFNADYDKSRSISYSFYFNMEVDQPLAGQFSYPSYIMSTGFSVRLQLY